MEGGRGREGRQLRVGEKLTANSLMFQNGCSTDEKPTIAMISSRTWRGVEGAEYISHTTHVAIPIAADSYSTNLRKTQSNNELV